MPLQMTGRPCVNASWTTSGEFSHHRDGKHDPVDVAHQPWQLAVLVGSGIRDVAAHLVDQLQELAAVRLGEVLDVGAVEVQMHVRLALGEDLHRSEQRLGALEGSQLPEERRAGCAAAPPRARRAGTWAGAPAPRT